MKKKYYKVWDETKHKMLYFLGIFNDHPFTDNSTPKYHKLVVMDYTGKTDLLGKGLYEDDVIMWPHLDEDVRYVVTWDQRELGYFAKCTSGKQEDDSWIDSSCKLVGNIHPNPELAKEAL